MIPSVPIVELNETETIFILNLRSEIISSEENEKYTETNQKYVNVK